MPPKVKYDRQAITQAALQLVREEGHEALNARAVAARLGCSTQPLYSAMGGMEDIRQAVQAEASAVFTRSLAAFYAPEMPAYKASGIAFLRFASEERQLYRLLFLRDRSRETAAGEDFTQATEHVYREIMRATGYSLETTQAFHRNMFIYIQGLASLIATGGDDLRRSLLQPLPHGGIYGVAPVV